MRQSSALATTGQVAPQSGITAGVPRASSTPVARNDRDALRAANVIRLLPGKTVKTAITTDDPRVVVNGVYSNYKVFEIRGDVGSRYHIELRSLCDCFGLDKLMLYPVARLLDDQGNTINDKPSHVALRHPDMRYPVNIQMNWEGTFSGSGRHYLLVSAYNEGIGLSYLTFREFDLLAAQMQRLPPAKAYLKLLSSRDERDNATKAPSIHPLWAFPTGKVVLVLRKD